MHAVTQNKSQSSWFLTTSWVPQNLGWADESVERRQQRLSVGAWEDRLICRYTPNPDWHRAETKSEKKHRESDSPRANLRIHCWNSLTKLIKQLFFQLEINLNLRTQTNNNNSNKSGAKTFDSNSNSIKTAASWLQSAAYAAYAWYCAYEPRAACRYLIAFYPSSYRGKCWTVKGVNLQTQQLSTKRGRVLTEWLSLLLLFLFVCATFVASKANRTKPFAAMIQA